MTRCTVITDAKNTDERQADEGKLVLEVQATALGLIPDLDEILDLAPEQFDVVSTEDQGLSVSKFDEEGDEIAVVSERTWMITMNAREGLEELPDTFTFGSALADGAEMEYQRFVDADLKSVEPIVSLEEHYGKRSLAFLLGWAVAVLGMIAVGGAGFVALRRTRRTTGPTVRFRMPESISPFTVIGLLREIEAENGVTEFERTELLAHIERLESFYFEDDQRETPDLRAIAETWVRRVN